LPNRNGVWCLQLTELAQYGVAALAIGLVGYVISQFAGQRNLNELIQNNTAALEKLTDCLRAMELSLTRQQAMLEELLERARRGE